MSTFAERIKAFLHHEVDDLTARLKTFFKSDAVKAIKAGIIAELKTDLGKLAIKATSDVEASMAGAPNGDKLHAAIAQVAKDATAAKLEFTDNIVHRLITSAVEAAKDHAVAPPASFQEST